jgi:hypothetical protein
MQYLNSVGMELNCARTNLRKKEKKIFLSITVIPKLHHNISENFIFVRENILKSDLIYLLQWDHRCYVYVFMFFQSVQAFLWPKAALFCA